MKHPPHLRTRGQDLGLAALSGAALAACTLVWRATWYSPDELSLLPLLGVLLGLALPLGTRLRLPQRAGLLPAGLLLLVLLGQGWVSVAHWSAGPALALCGAGVGAHLRLTRCRAGERLGAALLGWLVTLLVPYSWVAALIGFGGVSFLLRAEVATEGEPHGDRLWATCAAAGVSLRTGATAVVAVSALAFLPAEVKDTTVGFANATEQALAPLAAGLLVGLLVARTTRWLRHDAVAILWELAGWALLLALVSDVSGWLAQEGWEVRAGLALAATLGGLALAGPLERGGAWGLLAVALAWPTGALLLDHGAERWGPVESVALAMGKGGEVDDALRTGAEADALRVRFAHPGPGAVHVVDVQVKEREHVRLLALDGEVQGGAPTHRRRSPEVLVAPILEAALPLLLCEDAPRRAAVIGLGTGVQSGVVLGAGVEELALVESRRGVIEAHRDAGDLFGFISHRPLEDPRTVLHATPLSGWARAHAAQGWDGIVASGRPLDGGDVPLLVAGGSAVSWTVRELSGADMPGTFPYAFSSGDGRIVVVHAPGKLSLDRLRERLESSAELRVELRRVGLDDPLAILARLLAGPSTLTRDDARARSEEELLALGQVKPDQDVDFGSADAEAAEAMASVAELMSLAHNAAALPLALAATQRDRTARTLRVLGDLLLPAGQQEQALEAWHASLEVDPQAVATRLSLAVFHEKARQWKVGLEVLTPAVGVDEDREHQVRYHLGKLALGAKDYPLAKRHLRKAKGFANADDLLLLANQLAVPSEPGKLPPGQKLKAAERLLSKARGSRDPVEARRLWDDAVAALLPVAHDPGELSRAEHLRLARALERAAGSRGVAAAKVLRGLEAKVLSPYVDDPRIVIRRARALAGAGRGEEGETLLAPLTEAAGPRQADAVRALGEVLAAQAKWEAACAAWSRYLDMTEPTSAHVTVYLALANAERRRGRAEHAVRALQAADRLQPHPTVRLNLGTLLLELGRKGQAHEAYRRFLEVAPSSHPMRPRVEALLGEE